MLIVCLSLKVVIFAFGMENKVKRKVGADVRLSYREDSDMSYKVRLLDMYLYFNGIRITATEKVILMHYCLKGVSEKSTKEIVEMGLVKNLSSVYNIRCRMRKFGLLVGEFNDVRSDLLGILRGCKDFARFVIVVEK